MSVRLPRARTLVAVRHGARSDPSRRTSWNHVMPLLSSLPGVRTGKMEEFRCDNGRKKWMSL